LNTAVLDGMANARQPSLLLVAVTNFGVVAATALLGGAVLVPELVPLVDPAPLELPPLEPVPFGGVVAPPDVLVVGGVVVPVVVVSAVEPAELAALLEPQALSAPRHTSEIAGKIEARSSEAEIIATCIHSLSCDRGTQVTEHN
jgi:hypothetical protein